MLNYPSQKLVHFLVVKAIIGREEGGKRKKSWQGGCRRGRNVKDPLERCREIAIFFLGDEPLKT